jgi:hypothetical protein
MGEETLRDLRKMPAAWILVQDPDDIEAVVRP